MNLEFDLECPHCGRVEKIPMGQLRAGSARRCAGCSAELRVEGSGFTEAQRQLDDFERNLKNLFRQ